MFFIGFETVGVGFVVDDCEVADVYALFAQLPDDADGSAYHLQHLLFSVLILRSQAHLTQTHTNPAQAVCADHCLLYDRFALL